ncbi:putative integral membrane protein conserved region-domain-containing protein [Parasitella parasitica]|nr:putative integral membrane protein conserved region-domain-containing protein [Parasitella parasitica]
MTISFQFLFAYILGGLTLIPLSVIALYIVYTVHDKFFAYTQQIAVENKRQDKAENESSTGHLYKVGWLKVSRDEDQSTPDASIGDMVKNYISGKASKRENANIYFSVLKYNMLYLYDSEKQLDCKGVINLCNHTVAMHPPGLQDYELYSKPHLIKLQHKDSTYYINCHKCIDKEDWYFAFIRASKSTLLRNKVMHDNTHFDQSAMNHLITMVHSDEHHFQTQWLNAILGRVFFGVYRTQDIKDALYKKVITKLDKINAKRPPFLGEITVRSVDPGHSLPRFTQPKLLGLSPTGELTAEAHMQYDGGFRIEIETVLKWKYSDLLRPLTIDLVLGITLKEIQGKLLIKIKEPPTNRLWYAFHECPKMEWKVEPVVWEKRVGYSVVVKAIETKIQEFIMETMVLPHFDDITFFPTDGVGGIFEISPPQLNDGPSGQKNNNSNNNNNNNNNAAAAAASHQDNVSASPPVNFKKAQKDRHKADEALLITAKSFPELFSNVPDRSQLPSKLRSSLDKDTDIISNASAPILLQQQQQPDTHYKDSHSPMLIPADNEHPSSTGQIAIHNPNNNHDPLYLSTSPDDSLLSSSPCSLGEDRTISHVLAEDASIIVTPSTSSSLTCDSLSNIQTTYSQGSATSDNSSMDSSSAAGSHNHQVRLRKSASLALLRPKTGASTAVNVSPAMAHKSHLRDRLDDRNDLFRE